MTKRDPEIRDINSSDDDIPLVSYKKLPATISDVHSKQIRNNRCALPRKSYRYGQQVFYQSDSESSDFDKYLYFDERRMKRKLRLPPTLTIEDLEKQLLDIKEENARLIQEHQRINSIKLSERLKLRKEINRLKSIILDLGLENFNPNISFNGANTAKFIQTIKDGLNQLDYRSMSTNDAFLKKLANFGFTSCKFWEEFNSTEKKINSTPFWTGDLQNVYPVTENDLNAEECVRTSFLVEQDTTKINRSDMLNESDESPPASNDNTFSDLHEDFGEPIKTSCVYMKTNKTTAKIGPMNMVEGSIEKIASDTEPFIDTEENLFENQISSDEEDIMDKLEETTEGICTECGYGSSWTSFVSRHRDAYSKNAKIPPCGTCNQKFLKHGHFDGKHKKAGIRKTARPHTFVCEECGRGCTTLSGLTQHRLTHGVGRYSCAICSYKCRRRSYLNVHMKIHNDKGRQSVASEALKIKRSLKNNKTKRYVEQE